MQRLTKTLFQQNRNHFSFFKKFMKLINNDDKHNFQRNDHVDTSLDQIKHNEHYQFPIHKELTNKRTISLTHEEDMQQFVDTQKEITDLERLRMQKLDQALGTNTHFHEIENYEERLDSEHVMRRKIVALEEVKKERVFQLNNVLNIDPQEKIKKPNIVLQPDYFKKFQNIVCCPKHEKDPQQIEFLGKIYIDNYSYLQNKDNLENSRIASFVLKENMFSKMKFIKNRVIFDTLLEECTERGSVFHQQQIISKDYIYYSKDPNFGHAYHNIYRCPSKKYNVNQLEINPEQLIFSQVELLNYLRLDKELKYDIDIQNFIENLEDEKIQLLYDEINFSNDHNWVSFTFDILGNQTKYLVLLKNIQTQKVIIIKDIAPTTGFIQFDGVSQLIHVELSDLGVYRKLIMTNLESLKQSVIKEFTPGQNVQLQTFELDEYNQILIHVNSLNRFEQEVYQVENGKCFLLHTKKENCQILIDINYQFQFKALNVKGQGIKEIQYQTQFFNQNDQKLNEKTDIINIKNYKQFETLPNLQTSGIIYSCEENEQILDFCALKNYLVMIILDKETHRTSIKHISMNKRKIKTLELDEYQYSIEKEQNQNRNSNNFLFVNQCPYKPYQVLSYNLDMGTIEIFFQEHFSGFDQDRVKSEQQKIHQIFKRFSITIDNNSENFTFFYYKDKVYDQSTLLLILKDDLKLSLQNEMVSLLERGFIISLLDPKKINTAYQFEFLRQFIKNIIQCNLSKKISLYCDGPISGFNGMNFILSSPGAVDILISHNGLYNSLNLSDKQLLNYLSKNDFQALIKYDELKQQLLTDSPYYIEEQSQQKSSKEIPKLKNTLFTCNKSNKNASSTRQIVAMMRENQINNSDILDDYRVNFIEFNDEQTNQEIVLEHFSFLIASAYLTQK